MKIRNGFVSNSSSSSFVLVIEKSAYGEVWAHQDPITQAILNTVMGEDTVLGRECRTYGDNSSDYWWDDIDRDEVVELARKLAGDQPIITGEHAPSDPEKLDEYLRDCVSEGLGEYSIKELFKDVPDDQKWSYDMDW